MPLDPQAKAFLEQMEQAGAPTLEQLSVEENRATMHGYIPLAGPPEEVANVENVSIPVDGGEIGLRIYTPVGNGPFPVFVYFHGGGWVVGDLDVVDPTMRAVTNASSCLVVSVDYRMAPEYPFPVAPEDCYTATNWVAQNIATYHGDPSNIAVGGDSAGGNLAAVVSLLAKERGGPAISYQILVYPATDFSFDTESHRENGEGYLLTKAAMEWFANHYIQEEDKTSPLAAPLRAADVSGLPPALVITAEFDPLRDEGEAYAKKLQDAGVQVELTRYNGMIHGFFWMSGIMEQGRKAIEQVSNTLKNNAAKTNV